MIVVQLECTITLCLVVERGIPVPSYGWTLQSESIDLFSMATMSCVNLWNNHNDTFFETQSACQKIPSDLWAGPLGSPTVGRVANSVKAYTVLGIGLSHADGPGFELGPRKTVIFLVRKTRNKAFSRLSLKIPRNETNLCIPKIYINK